MVYDDDEYAQADGFFKQVTSWYKVKFPLRNELSTRMQHSVSFVTISE